MHTSNYIPYMDLMRNLKRCGLKIKYFFERYEGYISTQLGPQKNAEELKPIADQIRGGEMIVTILVSVIVGWLFGIWLNKQAYDELKPGKKWFRAIIWTSAIAFLISIIFFRDREGFESLVGAILFLATISYSSYRKSNKS